MKKFVSFILIVAIISVNTSFVFAAPPDLCPDGTAKPTNGVCKNTSGTNQTLSTFKPALNVGVNDGNSFSGLSFSGVGGAILSCSRIGESAVSGALDLFKSSKTKKNDSTETLKKKTSSIGTEEQAVTDAKATEELRKQTQRANCLDGIAYATAKNMLQQTSVKTLNWVKTGLGGNPLYVQDIDSFIKGVRDEKLRTFLDGVQERNPIFGNDLKNDIIAQITGKSNDLIRQGMDTPEAKKYQAFQNDFKQGGWGSLLNQKNNYLSATFNTVDELASEVNTAEQNKRDEIQRNNGFLDFTTCAEWQLGGKIVTKDAKGNVVGGDGLSGEPTCSKKKVATPGSIISEQVSQITNSPVRQLEYANKINEVLGSFFDSMVNRFFSEGLAGLSNSQGNTNGTNIVLGTDGKPIDETNKSADTAFGYSAVSEGGNGGFYGEFDISRPQQIRAILETQVNFLNRTQDARKAMSRVVPVVGKLDYCYPGPNPTWKTGLNYNAEIFLNALVGKKPTATLGSTISSITSIGAALPGPGTIIAAVGAVVGPLVTLAGGDQPLNVETKGLELFDKVTNGPQVIGDYFARRAKYFDNISLPDLLRDTYSELVTAYTYQFDTDGIKKLFITASPNEDPVVVGKQVDEVVDEISTLVYYDQAITLYDKQYQKNIASSEDAINKLTYINDEVQNIVDVAKKRYIAQRAAAGDPVNMRCINEAYTVNKNPVTGVARKETNDISPTVRRSNEANNLFYNNL